MNELFARDSEAACDCAEEALRSGSKSDECPGAIPRRNLRQRSDPSPPAWTLREKAALAALDCGRLKLAAVAHHPPRPPLPVHPVPLRSRVAPCPVPVCKGGELQTRAGPPARTRSHAGSSSPPRRHHPRCRPCYPGCPTFPSSCHLLPCPSSTRAPLRRRRCRVAVLAARPPPRLMLVQKWIAELGSRFPDGSVRVGRLEGMLLEAEGRCGGGAAAAAGGSRPTGSTAQAQRC